MHQPSRQSIVNRRIHFKKVSNDSIDPQYARLRQIYKPINQPIASRTHSYQPESSQEAAGIIAKDEAFVSHLHFENLHWQPQTIPSPCLVYLQPLFNYAITKDHPSKCQTPGFCALCIFHQHVQRCLSTNQKHAKSRKPFMPVAFIKGLRNIAKTLRHGRQEDAHEFLRFLVEALQKSVDGREMTQTHKQTNPITRLFGGRFEGLIKCKSCGHESRTNDPFFDLSLDITHASTLQMALKRFTSVDYLTGSNRYKCENCHKLVDAEKSLSIHQPPPLLCVQLKRFKYTSFGSSRIGKHVDFTETLDLAPFMSKKCAAGSDARCTRYSLQAALIHAGNSPNSGHYYCFIKSPAGIWYRMDDEEVSQVKLSTVLQSNAYILFYVHSPSPVVSRLPREEFGVEPQRAEILGKQPCNLESLGSIAASSHRRPKIIGSDSKVLMEGIVSAAAATRIAGKNATTTPALSPSSSRDLKDGRSLPNESSFGQAKEESALVSQISSDKALPASKSSNVSATETNLITSIKGDDGKIIKRTFPSGYGTAATLSPRMAQNGNAADVALLLSKPIIESWDSEKPKFMLDLPRNQRKRRPHYDDLEYDRGKEKKRKKSKRQSSWEVFDAQSKRNPFTQFQLCGNQLR